MEQRWGINTNMSGVYIIVCTANNKFYIGSSGCLEERYEEHNQDSKIANFKIKEMNADVIKYGSDSFIFDVLCTCNYKITTLLESYFIEKYEAKVKGYNKINASKNLKKNSCKYRYTYILQEEILDSKYNNLLDLFMVDIFDYRRSKSKIMIPLGDLITILEVDYKINLSIDLMPILKIIYKLDLDVYIKQKDNSVYIISGNQIFSLLNANRIHSFLKSDTPIDEKLKLNLWNTRNLNDIILECPALKKEIKCSVNINDSTEFKYKYKITDIRYTCYLHIKKEYY